MKENNENKQQPKNAPVLKIKAGKIQASVFVNTSKDGIKFDSIVLQRSYLVDDKWQNESINVSISDISDITAVLGEVLRQRRVSVQE